MPRWVGYGRYRRCGPNFIVGRWPILAAVSMICYFVCDPATLLAAFGRVAGNRGACTPGIDGLTLADVEEIVGVRGFLDDLRADLKTGLFRPLPVRGD
jgi:hypothetical protein